MKKPEKRPVYLIINKALVLWKNPRPHYTSGDGESHDFKLKVTVIPEFTFRLRCGERHR